MTSILGVQKSASAAFAPDAPYLATGTMAGAVDLSFSSTANLDIFKLDFSVDDRNLILAGGVASSDRFNRLSWGKPLVNSEEFSLGIIAGGLVDGNITLWNPKPLISSQGSENSVVGNLQRHKGPVRGLEFNSLSPNLLASGADEGEICIWDVAKPEEPTHFPPLKGSGSATQGEISFLSWNSKVQHILASTSFNGTTAVWDLKKQKPVISFTDSVRRRCSVLQWHPDEATQLIVASDEDNSPTLRLWDMRNIMSPVKEFVGHTKGVIAMAWCPIDSSYLLTCAKDNRTICWDVASGEIVSELPAGTNWNFDVHWYPKIPGVISTSSFDGKIGIYNIEGSGRYAESESVFGAAPLKAPKWYKRKAGVSFGFGGKLVSFHTTESRTSEVYVHTLPTEDGLVSRSSEFEAAVREVRGGEKSSLKLLCEKKSQDSESVDEKETWGFLKVLLEEDGTARSHMLTHLGFTQPTEEKEATPEDDISEQVIDSVVVPSKEEYGTNKEYGTDNGEDFFNNLPSPKADTPLSTSGDNFVVGGESIPVIEESSQEVVEEEESDESSFDEALERALIVADYKGAVAQCLSANRMADALVIAHAGGDSLWETTRNQYLNSSRSPYLKVVSAMVNKDLKSLVNARPLKSWKETLALLCTFAGNEEWSLLCDALASRLMSAGNTLGATLCYICAGNIDKTVEIWSKSLSMDAQGKSYADLLQDLMEKTIVFALASGQKRFSAFLCKLVEKYVEILASQGQLNTAMEYLKLMGNQDLTPELVILRDCIALSTQPEKEEIKAVAYDNSQYQTGPTTYNPSDPSNFGVVDTSHQQYYPEPTPTHNIPNSPYSDNNYQQPNFNTPYNTRNYNTPAVNQYQPTPQHQHQPNMQQPQPNLFLPYQAPQVPQGNFAPAPITNQQPPAKPFVPANPPMLKNVEQYQPPTTLGSQLYPGGGGGGGNPSFQGGGGPPGVNSFNPNPSSQLGPAPLQKMPQGVPTQPPRGFMPINNNTGGLGLGVQRPMQPPSPTHSAPVQTPVTPPTPPPTVHTADTSNVPAHQKSVIATLTRLFNETSEALGGARANPSRKREIDDNSKKLGALFAKLNSGDISKNAAEKLTQLCQALDNGDFSTALQIQVLLTTSDWDECNFWLATLKRMIKSRQTLR